MHILQKWKESTTVEFLEIESNSEYNGYKMKSWSYEIVFLIWIANMVQYQ